MNKHRSSEGELPVGGATRAGHGRPVNEDSFWIAQNLPQTLLARKGHLYVVADGIGGHQKGEVASRMAAETIRRTYYEDPNPDVAASLRRAIETASAEIHRQAQDPTYAGMGSTVVAAVVRGDDLVVANAGDSRAYLLRDGTLKRLTEDHTWVAERAAAGVLTPEEAAHHEMRHLIIRSLGDQPTVQVEVRPYRLLAGDRLLLCSDGVWEPVSEREIASLLRRRRPQAAATQLVERAAAAGGVDDATALVVALEPAGVGVLGRVEGTVQGVLASPAQRALLVGMGAVLAVAMVACGILKLLGPGAAQPAATATSSAVETTDLAPSPMPLTATGPVASVTLEPTIVPTNEPTATAMSPEPTLTPSVESSATATPEPTRTTGGARYCILPSENPLVGAEFPANAVDPNSCEEIGVSISVGEEVWVANDSMSQRCRGNVIITVAYYDRRYWIFAHRIGEQPGPGKCEAIENWREFFAEPRE
jgi:serine/threonine protein phosphatase PrpC